jgi:hypothetical protein
VRGEGKKIIIIKFVSNLIFHYRIDHYINFNISNNEIISDKIIEENLKGIKLENSNKNNINNLKNKGFAINFHLDEILKIYSKGINENDNFHNLYDVVICTNEDLENFIFDENNDENKNEENIKKNKQINSLKIYMENLKTLADNNPNLKSVFLYKKQINTDFNIFFSVFRMNILVLLKYEESINDILIEVKEEEKTKIYKKEDFDLIKIINTIRLKLKKRNI